MNGEGVSKIDGKIVLIPKALIDETVDIDIVNDYTHYAEARINDILEKSNNRDIPPCPYFDICGGCDLQHMNYVEQLKFKQLLIKKTIKKITGIDVTVAPTVASDYQFKYRNKISINNDENQCGFFVEKSKKIIDIDQCLLANNNISLIYTTIRKWINSTPCNTRSQIKNIVIREINNQALVGVVSRSTIDLSTLYEQLAEVYNNIGLYSIINRRHDSVVLSGKVKHIAGIKTIKIENYGLTYFVDLMSFHQTNINIQDKLYKKVLDYVDENAKVINGFSGQGLLTAIMAKKADHVTGIEINESANASAEELKRLNKIENMTNIIGDFNNEFLKLNKHYDTLILDPSKKGCGEKILSRINNIKNIIYISCNPIALAKDLKILITKYNIEEVTPFDMFPNTKSVETLVKLKLKEN